MPKTAFAAAALAATAALVPAVPAAAAAASTVAPTAATKPLHLRGGLTLHLPTSWKVYGRGDHIRVITGRCVSPKGGWGQPECDSFWVLGPKAIKHGQELFNPYTAEHPYYPATDVQLCPHNRKWGQVLGGASVKGLRQVGPGHKAHYREWKATCVSYSTGKVKSRYVQREWFLPQTKVLVVDQWDTPGLSGVLKRATWR
ncbi:hypothetical protein ACWGH8_40940 [Nonomuraea muscovyensis]|uniref:Uncharacterized protein n=1 Tax=Nonomuraea muscovyensis TaxID=1124761 RepID=A0A7X0BYZ2_9ACTN|nr:hypothetical protein [Nonomuraea muscovyensis]MBB6345385.1 hypothetical protein [Nonomuraea muscovyensis]